MLFTLQTLKAKSFQDQVHAIELLAKRNLDLFEKIRSLVEDYPPGSIFQIYLLADSLKTVQIALMAVIADDITTIPDQDAREPYRRRLEQLCTHFGVEARDLEIMLHYTPFIKDFLKDRA
jgi:hypothetical protein